MDTPADYDFMAQAIVAAAGVRHATSPNPWVGAVVVADGVVVGTGATSPPGGPHAEVHVLASAGESAQGVTLYATLEPCGHQGLFTIHIWRCRRSARCKLPCVSLH